MNWLLQNRIWIVSAAGVFLLLPWRGCMGHGFPHGSHSDHSHDGSGHTGDHSRPWKYPVT